MRNTFAPVASPRCLPAADGGEEACGTKEITTRIVEDIVPYARARAPAAGVSNVLFARIAFAAHPSTYNKGMDILAATKTLMESNRRISGVHQYTVPSPQVYPFQWLWDSCFHAIILAKFDIAAAKAELRSALARPLPSGMIPHLIYWKRPKDTGMNWGRELRGDIINASWGVDGTSAITQPPIMAKAVMRVYEADADMDFLREAYDVLRAHHRYLRRDRSLRNDGLIFIINPDESGEDNSPRFDQAQGLPIHHTADQNLDRRILRMRENVACKFHAKTCTSRHFSIVEVSFNVIYSESLGIMGKIAETLGEMKDARQFFTAAAEVHRAIRSSLCIEGRYLSYDLQRNEPIRINTWNLFMPLYGGLLSQKHAAELIEGVLLDAMQFWTNFPVPTVSKQDASYDLSHDAFWRGPVWMAPNWFIYHGLCRYGYHDIAAELKKKSITLIERSGFREHYHPVTGEGLGVHDFTWGGLVLDME